jgi:hypothetical protein
MDSVGDFLLWILNLLHRSVKVEYLAPRETLSTYGFDIPLHGNRGLAISLFIHASRAISSQNKSFFFFEVSSLARILSHLPIATHARC